MEANDISMFSYPFVHLFNIMMPGPLPGGGVGGMSKTKSLTL